MCELFLHYPEAPRWYLRSSQEGLCFACGSPATCMVCLDMCPKHSHAFPTRVRSSRGKYSILVSRFPVSCSHHKLLSSGVDLMKARLYTREHLMLGKCHFGSTEHLFIYITFFNFPYSLSSFLGSRD
jgi:hypothetical protein